MGTVASVPTRLTSVVIDAADPPALARFWSTATGWPITYETADEAVVEPPEDDAGRPTEPGLPLVIVLVDDEKVGKNRVHLDLASRRPSTRPTWSSGCVGPGRLPSTSGRGRCRGWSWPTPRGTSSASSNRRGGTRTPGRWPRIVVDTPDPTALASFWEAASGWVVGDERSPASGCAAPTGPGPWLELLPTDDPKVAKNRVHLDVAPYAADDQVAEVERLQALGAATSTSARASRPGWCWPIPRAASSACSAHATTEARVRVHCAEPPFRPNLTVCQIAPVVRQPFP